MSNQKNNFNNGCCKKTENLNKEFLNNNNNKSKNLLLSSIIISQSKTGGGTLRYGNFGSLLNGRTINNQAVKSLINNIKTQQENNSNFNNNVYINNLINDYSSNDCLYGKTSPYNYNEFYTNYIELQSLLKKNNIYQNYCVKRNNYF
jgi:hypothetical protein